MELTKEELLKKRIDGKAIATERNNKIADYVKTLKEDYCLTPRLVIIQVGESFASTKYVYNKIKAAIDIGISYNHMQFDESASEHQIICAIKDLNVDMNVHGIIVQLPLPAHIDESRVMSAISDRKDVDGFNPINIGRLHSGNKPVGRIPCTANGVVELIKSTGEEIAGKNVVVLGRSNIVGRPVAALLEQENATVTICHSKTPSSELALAVRQADIIVSAIGKSEYLTKGVIGINKIVIDVGINIDDKGNMCGDVNYYDVLPFAKYITPVPGGVGPMTVSCLMENVVRCTMEDQHLPQEQLNLAKN